MIVEEFQIETALRLVRNGTGMTRSQEGTLLAAQSLAAGLPGSVAVKNGLSGQRALAAKLAVSFVLPVRQSNGLSAFQREQQ